MATKFLYKVVVDPRVQGSICHKHEGYVAANDFENVREIIKSEWWGTLEILSIERLGIVTTKEGV